MKEYPYIGKGKNSGYTYLVVSEDAGYIIDGSGKINYGVFVDKLNTERMEDITREYLEDKTIKVSSPEHREYVLEIAKRYGWSWFYCENLQEERIADGGYIEFYKDLSMTCGRHCVSSWEEIYIPLPESITEFKVGDKVSLRYRYDSKSIHCTGELLYLSDKHIILEDSDGNDILKLRCDYDIEEDLSEEELLLNSLDYDIQISIDRGDTAYGIAYNLLQEYSITKKPQ